MRNLREGFISTVRQRKSNAKGFNLVELLIVIIIFVILAFAIIPEVTKFLDYSNSIKEEGIYSVYSEQGGIQNEIGTINLGEVIIQYPGIMAVNKSGLIAVSIIPTQNKPTITTLSDNSIQPPNTYNLLSDPIDLYPIMNAKLLTANFVISSQDNGLNEEAGTNGALWEWIVSPQASGKQLLIVEIDVPIQIQGLEGQGAHAVYSKSLMVSVGKPLNLWLLVGGIGAILLIVIYGFTIKDNIEKTWKSMKPHFNKK